MKLFFASALLLSASFTFINALPVGNEPETTTVQGGSIKKKPSMLSFGNMFKRKSKSDAADAFNLETLKKDPVFSAILKQGMETSLPPKDFEQTCDKLMIAFLDIHNGIVPPTAFDSRARTVALKTLKLTANSESKDIATIKSKCQTPASMVAAVFVETVKNQGGEYTQEHGNKISQLTKRFEQLGIPFLTIQKCQGAIRKDAKIATTASSGGSSSTAAAHSGASIPLTTEHAYDDFSDRHINDHSPQPISAHSLPHAGADLISFD